MKLETKEKKSLTELNFIINNLSSELQSKIPDDIIESIIDNMDVEYQIKIDINKTFTEQEYLPETRALFSLIVSKYLCSEKEKKKWEEFDNKYEELTSINVNNSKYVDIFESNQKYDIENTSNINEKQLIIYRKTIWNKLIDKIKSIFKKWRK